MKKITIIMFFMLISISLTAQNKETSTADKLFDRYEYVQASKEYLNLVDQGTADGYAYKQLADCFYNMENTVEAEKWYAEAVKYKQDPEVYFKYYQVLKSNGKYEEANSQMKVFASLLPNDDRAKDFKSNPDYLLKLKNIEPFFDLSKLAINTDKSTFGAVLYGNTLYFASARNNATKIYGWNNEPFLDLFQAEFSKADNTYSEPTPISELNTIYHEGPLTMTKDGNTIYFSSESFNEKLYERDNVKKLKFGQVSLYKAVKENGKWSNITPLPFNSKSYSTGNPSIDKDGKTLYFASNMPGSIGGTDIWKVAVNADGSFGTPENLGNKINTAGDENFPYVTDDNILYFSSNGLQGLGGLDVFSVNLDKKEEPKNLGSSVNSQKDDFAFTFDKENKIGYLSSNRLGSDNIYSAMPICKAQILTVIKNAKTAAALVNAKVVVLDENKKVITTQMSNDKGEFLYDAVCNKKYEIEVYKDGFVTKSFAVNEIEEGRVAVEAIVEPMDVIVTDTEIILNTIYFNNNRSGITDQAAEELDKLVYVMSQNQDLKIYVKSHTDERGKDDYNMDLSERRANSTVNYVISKGISADRITGKGFGESEFKVDCGLKCTEDEHASNRRSEFMIVK